MALLFPHPALSPKPPFPSTLRSTRPRSATRIRGLSSPLPPAAPQSPSTSSPSKAPAPGGGAEIRNKKNRRNLKPSFEEQALRRWSARAPSQRASFPWQRQQQPQPAHRENEAAHDQAPSSATLRSIVEYFDYGSSDDGDGGVDVDAGAGARGDGGASKGKDSVAHGEVDQDDREEESRSQPSYLLGSRPVSAPWMHGQGHTVVDQLLLGRVGGEEEVVDMNGVSDDELSSVDENEEWVDNGELLEEEPMTVSLEGELYDEDPAVPTANSSFQLDSITDRGSAGSGFDRSTRRSSVSSIVNTLRNSMEESGPSATTMRSDAEDFVQELGHVLLPWEREDGGAFDGDRRVKRTNAELAERTIPEPELRRLRDAALRMKERMRIGPGGVTHGIVETIHSKWKVDEVVKLRFEGPPSLNMKRTHEILEDRTGGIVIWRSGRSIVLYRGMNYNLRCVQSFAKTAGVDSSEKAGDAVSSVLSSVAHNLQKSSADGVNQSTSILKSPQEATETFDIDSFLDQLGPRYKDWSGRSPIPVDADLLPGLVPGYKPPFRQLPYRTKISLKDKEMTALRRLARQTTPHFALGRNREHQGLATAIVKLWEKSSIVKIAIKRGVPNTCNDRMAEEIKMLMPLGFEYNGNSSCNDGEATFGLSQDMGMSYTEMLLSVEAPSLSQSYLHNNGGGSSMVEPMGSENKTFMITGRYASSPSILLDENGDEEEQPQFGDRDEVEEDEEQADIDNERIQDDDADKFYNWHWNDKWQPNDNGQQNECSEGKENHNSDNINIQAEGAENYQAADMDMPDGVEQLTPEDIRLFLESESVKAAKTSSQEAIGHHVPHINMIFDTEEEAYKFYNEYASICGFSVKKAGNYKGKNAGEEKGTRRTYTCNKFSKVVAPDVLEERKLRKKLKEQERNGKVPQENRRKRRTNVNEITGCKAKMVVTLKESKWHVTNIDLHHNHELCHADESKFLRSHKEMTDQEKLFVRTFTSVKLATRKIMAILTYLRGGKPRNVPYTKKYVSNVMTAIRQEDNRNDMMKVLDYFRKRKDEDPRFHYEFNLGEGNKVLCIFWVDSFSRHMYDLYGDVVSFDTTFKTNKYNLPFAPFVGVTGHGHNCLFGCAIINNEQGETFKWLFKAFKLCHGGKDPVTIITDQDRAMENAIDAVFPNSCHRNCFFHVKKKAEEKCGGSFGRIPNLHIDFSDILRNSLTVAEFEYLWPQMIEKYNVSHLKYLKIMWDNRSKFVPVYFKRNFCPFVHSTARSEGTNAIFKDNVGSTYSVISFLGEYQKISENIEELEKEQDTVTRTTDPSFCLHTELEMQASRMYNRKIFYRFQKQILFAAKLHVDEVERFVRYEVYKTPMLQMQEIRPRRYLVSVNLRTQEFVCICCKFDKDGIVCAHILRVLVHLNMSELPDKYYIKRWRPKERKYLRDSQFNIPFDLTTSNKHLRYSVLSRRLNNLASEGSETNRKYMFVTQEIKRIEERLDEMTVEDEAEEVKNRDKGKQPALNIATARTDDGYSDFLQDPDVAPSKGRPENSKRQKTFMEQLFSKNKITCSHCGSHAHNIATCTNKHLPKESFQSKTTKRKKNSSDLDAPTTKQARKTKESTVQGKSATKSNQSSGKSGCL